MGTRGACVARAEEHEDEGIAATGARVLVEQKDYDDAPPLRKVNGII